MNLEQELRSRRKKLDRQKLLQKMKQKWAIAPLAIIFILALYLRYSPAQGMKYLQAADPYWIYRMSQHIALEGNYPVLDFMRYFPYAIPNYTVQLGDLFIPAILYNAGFSLLFPSYLEWAQFYPALLGALSTVVMYFLGKELFNRKAGLSAAFFLAVLSGTLRRTSAGFFEKEPLGTFLMLSSLVFFTQAWKRENWFRGILSGLALGLFTVSWGGSQMLWLLYPIVTGAALFLNIELRPLIRSYTPTVIVGGLFASVINPARFWPTSSLFLIAFGALGALWLLFLVKELELIQQKYQPYFMPGLAVLGGIGAILSPLYSQWLADKILVVINVALGKKGGVIGQTVQENAPPGIVSVASNMGTALARSGNPAVEVLGMIFSPWTFMTLSLTVLGTALLLKLGQRFDLVSDKVEGRKYLSCLHSMQLAVIIIFAGLLVNIFFMSALAAVAASAFALAAAYLLEEEAAYKITYMMLAGGLVGVSLLFTAGRHLLYLTALPTALIMIGSLVKYTTGIEAKEIRFNWVLLVPLLYVFSNLYGGMTRSRLVFLATFAVALGAGHGLNVVIKGARNMEIPDFEMLEDSKKHKIPVKDVQFALVLLLVPLIVLNGFSGYGMSQGIRGSPPPSPEVWEPSVEFMQQTPPGSVTLSWWDYGYHFQTLGRTASVADGGNLRYYTNETHQNIPLAGMLNSTVEGDREFIDKHSADYIWLDYSMIGKFAAVSQIANKDNQNFESIRRFRTPGSLRQSLSTQGNETVATFQAGRTQLFAPIEITNSSAGLSGQPTIRAANGRSMDVGCVITEEGKKTYQTDSDLGFCVAEDPFYSLERGVRTGSSARVVIIPEKISDSTFVELYIQDGENVPYAEKVPEASNRYIKMWKIKDDS
jgi:asparagine N-glycosylation enzyme membrane subunit Stt3